MSETEHTEAFRQGRTQTAEEAEDRGRLTELRQQLYGAATQQMLEAAYLKPGDHILDIAAGTGDQCRQAARLVGREGSILATDISQEMLAVAARLPKREGLSNLTIRVMNAEQFDLPANRVRRGHLAVWPDAHPRSAAGAPGNPAGAQAGRKAVCPRLVTAGAQSSLCSVCHSCEYILGGRESIRKKRRLILSRWQMQHVLPAGWQRRAFRRFKCRSSRSRSNSPPSRCSLPGGNVVQGGSAKA